MITGRRILLSTTLGAGLALCIVAGTLGVALGAFKKVLTSFDIPLLGLAATPDPLDPVVPKNTESAVRILIHAGDRTLTTAEATTHLGAGFQVRAELAGPGLDHAITIPQLGPSDPPPDDPLLLRFPPLPLGGDYRLSNIRILGPDGRPLLDVTPSSIPVKVIDQVLVTSVKTRPLTLDEIRDKGIVLDSNSYLGFEFTLGLATESQSVSFSVPVVFDRQGVPVPQAISPPDAPPRTGVAISDSPDPLIIPTLLSVDQEVLKNIPDFEKVLRTPSGQPIHIPSVLVIPGNVGYLKQFFSAQLFVANGTPVGSGLNVRDVSGAAHLPPGADLQLGTVDDPLSLPETTRGPQATTLPVRAVGPDGIPATADDLAVLKPAEQGQAEFLIRGDKEGFHNLDFDINATLEGLPIGPVPVKGSAKGGVLVRNPFFNMTFTVPSTVRKGEPFSIFATVANISQSLANDVHVTLDASRTSGATLLGAPTQTIPTIKPRDARTLEFKFTSQRTGQMVATYLSFDAAGQNGGSLKFSLGVGERGVALSPDTLVLPAAVDRLPPTVVSAAMRVLGQAWSLSNAPTGTLPPDVIRTSRAVTTQKALALAEAGMRVSLGQPAEGAVRDLAFDFWGGLPLDPGFDQLLRQTNAGLELARAMGVYLAAAAQAAGGPLPYSRAGDTIAISGSDYIGIAVGNGTGAAPVAVSLVDPTGAQTDAQTSSAETELPRAAIPGAVWLPLGLGTSAPLLGILTAPSATSYTLRLAGIASGSVDLAITQPVGDGSFVRGVLTGLTVSAGSQARVLIDRREPDTLIVQIDGDGDGAFDSSQALATERLLSPGPKLISATVVGPETLDGASPFGFQVAALFDRVVEASSAALPGNYVIPKNSVQNARRQLSGRFVFASLTQPEGPYIPTTFATSNIRDGRGAVGPPTTVSLGSRLDEPGAVVSGRVVGADGAPVISGAVTYINNAAWTCPEAPGEATHNGFASVPLDAQGRYEFRYVRQDRCGYPWAMAVNDPKTGALRQVTGFVRAAGEQIVLDIALVGQGVVTGIVRDLANAPVPGAQVVVVSVTDPQVGGSAATDGDGRYTVYGITVGQVNVRAAKGASAGRASGNVPRAGAAAEIDLTLDGGAASVAGKVVVQEGTVTSTIPGIQVVFESAGTPVAVARTDASGAFAFSSAPVGPFRITAAMNARDRATATGVVAAGDALTSVNLAITVPDPAGSPGPGNQGYGTVAGTVRYPDGSVAPGVIVSIGERGVLTNDSGGFEIAGVPVRNGVPQSVTARSRDGLRSGAAVAVVNVPGQFVGGVSIALSGLGSAEFVVLGPTGAPIAGQDVGLLDRCQAACGCDPRTTGPDGKVRWDGLPLGTATASAVRSAVNFMDAARAQVSITRDGEVATATLRFAGAGVVLGTVRDGQQRPVFGADVTLQSLTFEPSICGLTGAVTQRVRTNTLGVYRFVGVNLGPVSVSASQPFFPTPVGKSGTLIAQGQELPLDLVLSDAASTIAGELSGTIYLPDGITPAGAGIEVTANGALPDVVVNTDASGRYKFAKIFSEGAWTLTARDPITGGVAQSSVFLRAAQDRTADLRLLGRGTVLVRVVDAADVPVQNAFVRLRETTFPARLFEGAVDPAHQGVVRFENVFEGPLSAEASDVFARGGRASSVLAGPGAILELKVRLSMTGKVVGVFVGPDGATPIPFGAVSLTANGRVIGQTTTQGSGADVGRFSFDFVPAGPVRIDVQDPATARTGLAVGTIESQNQIVDLTVRAQGLGTVKGVVTSNGAPQPGADVEVVRGGFRANTLTDSAGRYLVTGVPEGQVSATANLGAGFLSGTASANLVGDGTELVLNVGLRGSGKVAGRIVNADGVTPARPAAVSITVGGVGGAALTTVSDQQGNFTFDRVPAGLAKLTADVLGSVDHGAATREVIAATTTSVTIQLHGVGMLHGLALDSSGNATAGTVVLSGSGGDNPYTLTATAGANGIFLFPEVLAGPFAASLTVATATFTLYGSATGTIAPSQDNALTVRVQASGLVKGRVLRSNETTPAPGAEVTLELLPGRGSLILYTRDDGTFEVRGVPLGLFALRVRDPFSTGVAFIDGKTLASNGQTIDVGDITLDDTPVAVVSLAPVDGALQVPVTQPVLVTFSDPLQSAQGVVLSDGAQTLSASTSLSPNRLTITLLGTWPDAKEITVTATTLVTDIYGRRMLHPVTSHFRTVDLTPPRVASVDPANLSIEVSAAAIVTVTFNEALAPAADVSGVIALSQPSLSVAGTVSRTSETTATFTPSAALANDTVFTVTVNGTRDATGNVQTAAFTSTFMTHDTQPPTLALAQPAPGTWTNNPRPNIEVSVNDTLSGIDPNAGILSINDVSVQAVRTTTTISHTPATPLADGVHRIDAATRDRAGNTATLVAAVRVDTLPPSPAQLSNVVNGAVLTGAVLIAATAEDLGSGLREFRIFGDGIQLATLQPPSFQGAFDSQALADGPHALTAVAVDLAGNVGPAGAAVNVIVNNRAVAVVIVQPTAGASFRDNLGIKATVSEPVKQVVFSLGGVTVIDNTAPYESVLNIAGEPEGPTTLTATATGLLDETGSATVGVKIDRHPPGAPDFSIIFAEPPDNGQSLVFGQAGAVEAGARVSLANINGGATASTSAAPDGSFSTLLPAAIGDTVSVAAIDGAGNAGPPATVVVSATTRLPPLVATLSFHGTPVDRLGSGVAALVPDGGEDAVFELAFALGGVTRQLSFVELVGPALRSTRVEVGAALAISGGTVVPKADPGLGGPLLNRADGTVDATVTGDVSFLLFASAAGLLQPGATYTATAAFTNGARYVGTFVLTGLPTQELVGATFSVANQSPAVDLDPESVPDAGETSGGTFSVLNQSLMTELKPGGEDTGETTGATFSVANQSLAPGLNPELGDSGELTGGTFSVANQSLMPDLSPGEPDTGELTGGTFSVANQSLAPELSPEVAGTGELTGATFSVVNQTTFDGGVTSVDGGTTDAAQ